MQKKRYAPAPFLASRLNRTIQQPKKELIDLAYELDIENGTQYSASKSAGYDLNAAPKRDWRHFYGKVNKQFLRQLWPGRYFLTN